MTDRYVITPELGARLVLGCMSKGGSFDVPSSSGGDAEWCTESVTPDEIESVRTFLVDSGLVHSAKTMSATHISKINGTGREWLRCNSLSDMYRLALLDQIEAGDRRSAFDILSSLGCADEVQRESVSYSAKPLVDATAQADRNLIMVRGLTSAGIAHRSNRDIRAGGTTNTHITNTGNQITNTGNQNQVIMGDGNAQAMTIEGFDPEAVAGLLDAMRGLLDDLPEGMDRSGIEDALADLESEDPGRIQKAVIYIGGVLQGATGSAAWEAVRSLLPLLIAMIPV